MKTDSRRFFSFSRNVFAAWAFAELTMLSVVSCKSTQKAGTNALSYSYDTTYQTYKGDFQSKFTGGLDLLCTDTSTWIAWNYCGVNEIRLLDFNSDSVIRLPFHDPDCKKIYTTWVNKDFYVLTQSGTIWKFPGCEPRAEKVGNVFEDDSFKKSGLTPWEYKPGGGQQIIKPDSSLYINLELNFSDSMGKYSRYYQGGNPNFAKVNLKNGAVSLFGKKPNEAATMKYGMLNDQFSLYKGDSLIISNPFNADITVINTVSGKKNTFSRKSSYNTKLIQPFDPEQHTNDVVNANVRHYILSPNYESMFYNPYNQRYYRIFHPEMNDLNAQGLKNSEADKECVLMIFDKNFKLIDEVLLPIKAVHLVLLYPIRDGIACALPDLFKYNGSESVTYAYLNIHHK